jgi:hypothetical protein
MGKTGRGEFQAAASHENPLSDRGFQLLPEQIRAADEGNVLWRLGIGMANDSRLSTMAALVMDVVKLLEDESFQATFAERPGGGRSHRSAAKHDGVKGTSF